MTMVAHDLKPGDWLAQTAAGSTVGQLVLQLARSERFRTVNIVRRRAQVSDILALGGDVVITSEDDDWGTQLAKVSEGKVLSRAIDCVAGKTGATVARHLAPGGRMLVYGALSSHRQTDPSAFEMPVFAPRLIYSAATVQGWYLLHWLEVTPLAESRAIFAKVIDRLASGSLRLPPAKRYRRNTLRMPCATPMGHHAKASHCLILVAWLPMRQDGTLGRTSLEEPVRRAG
jgi:NADPH2:quinone reductase